MKKHGFSLLECLFTLTIMGILATLAYPSYLNHITKVHRTDAQLSLYHLAGLLESYYFEHHSYENATILRLSGTNQSYQKYYTLQLSGLTTDHYTISAIPNGAQGLQDKTCQTLYLDDRGQKGIAAGPLGEPTGSLNACW